MLPQKHRVTKGDDYRTILKSGLRAANPAMLIYVRTTMPAQPARFGFIVSKAVGKAHVRNLVRRRLKAASYDLIKDGLNGIDVVVRAHPASAATAWPELYSGLQAGVQQALARLSA